MILGYPHSKNNHMYVFSLQYASTQYTTRMYMYSVQINMYMYVYIYIYRYILYVNGDLQVENYAQRPPFPFLGRRVVLCARCHRHQVEHILRFPQPEVLNAACSMCQF